jgi:hypothetical protein
MSDELKERNILKLIFIVKFACATLDVGHLIYCSIAEIQFLFAKQMAGPRTASASLGGQ